MFHWCLRTRKIYTYILMIFLCKAIIIFQNVHYVFLKHSHLHSQTWNTTLECSWFLLISAIFTPLSLSHLLARPWAFPHSSPLLFWVSAPVILTFPSAADWQIVQRLIEARGVSDPPANSQNQPTSHFIKLQYYNNNYFTQWSHKVPQKAWHLH